MTSEVAQRVEILTEEEYAKVLREQQAALSQDDQFAALASRDAHKIIRREFSRKDVVEAFQRTFELMGGVPRMTLWAMANPTEFYKLYGRLLPSQASSALGESNELVLKMVIPATKLDKP